MARIAQGLIICMAWFAVGCSNNQESLSIEPMLASQAALYPGMEVQDWYKLLHQASMGNRHLGVEDSLIYAYLLGEWDRIEASDEEPLLEFISPDSSMVRLNLRAYKAAGGTPEAVFESMEQTWETFKPSSSQLVKRLDELRLAADRNKLSFQAEEVVRFIETQKREGFPAIHHSDEYEAQYKPAYRVLDRRFVP